MNSRGVQLLAGHALVPPASPRGLDGGTDPGDGTHHQVGAQPGLLADVVVAVLLDRALAAQAGLLGRARDEVAGGRHGLQGRVDGECLRRRGREPTDNGAGLSHGSSLTQGGEVKMSVEPEETAFLPLLKEGHPAYER